MTKSSQKEYTGKPEPVENYVHIDDISLVQRIASKYRAIKEILSTIKSNVGGVYVSVGRDGITIPKKLLELQLLDWQNYIEEYFSTLRVTATFKTSDTTYSALEHLLIKGKTSSKISTIEKPIVDEKDDEF